MVLSIYKLKFHSRKTLINVLFHAIEFVIIRVLTNANNDTAPNIFTTTLCVFPYTSIHRRLLHKKQHRNRYLLLLGMLFFNQPSEQRIRFFACFPARKQIKVRREYQLAGRTGSVSISQCEIYLVGVTFIYLQYLE